MTVTTWTLTGDVSSLVGEDWPTTGSAAAEAYLTAYDADGPCKFYVDTATGGKVRFGPTIPLTLAADGTFTRAGIPDSSETGLSYALTLTYRPAGHGRSVATTTDRFTLDADKALNQVGFVNPDFSPEAILAAAVDAAVAPLVTGGALTNPAVDAAVATLTANESSLTNAALAGRYTERRVLHQALTNPTRFPALTRVGVVASAVTQGTPKIGFPSVIRVDDLIASPRGTHYAFTSNDHGAGAGGIYLWHFNTPGDPWTYVGKVVTHPEGGALQIETPWVVWDAASATFRCYAQAQGTITGKQAGQVTCVWTSTDCETWTYIGISHDIESLSDLAQTQGGTHTGYQEVSRVGGAWVSRGLIRGSNTGRWATYYSMDGLRFYHDRSEDAGAQEIAPANREVNLFSWIHWAGRLFGVGVSRTVVSGDASGIADLVVGEARPDLSGFAGSPDVVYTPGTTATGDDGDLRSHCVVVDDTGHAHLYYHANGSHIVYAVGATP